jgi:hypothetical protein
MVEMQPRPSQRSVALLLEDSSEDRTVAHPSLSLSLRRRVLGDASGFSIVDVYLDARKRKVFRGEQEIPDIEGGIVPAKIISCSCRIMSPFDKSRNNFERPI